jgi:hypothetical protein
MVAVLHIPVNVKEVEVYVLACLGDCCKYGIIFSPVISKVNGRW